ncbi:FAD-dependent monooxygenase [Sphaerisporangium sp. NPDC051011]|uniref:FAD-dependent monooxygenase n=1 Tax=Sphaerisporangium sp. NPDC051011 TaxID=3155792 RepID=UPI0033D9F35D
MPVPADTYANDDAEPATDVIVVGAGPVGLTLAHELGSRGVGVALVDPHDRPDESSPRCKQLNPRSMEHFRRLGLADAIRDASLLPFGWSDSAVFCTTLTGPLVQRFGGVFATSDVPWSVLPEPAQWTAQFSVERALRAELATRPTVTPHWGSTLVDVDQDAGSVTATLLDDRGGITRLRARYLAAADGGRSTTRQKLGIELSGSSHGVENLQVIFDAPGLAARHRHGRALQYWILNDEISGLMGQLDTSGKWWAILIDAPNWSSHVSTRRAVQALIGADEPLRIVAQTPWTARMLLADRYREGRCFLLGDAAHLNPPWGGFGANTGIGDAVDLGWKIAAMVDGWGGEALLASYETERRPFAVSAIAAAKHNMAVLTPELSTPEITGHGEEGEQARRHAAEVIARSKSAETYTLGFTLGTGCPDSPLVLPDTRHAPLSVGSVYQPSACPGMRLPHLWLGPGVSLYDRLGPGFTLIECGVASASDGLKAQASRRGVPLTVLPINRPDAAALFDAWYVLVRPDQLVAWRGDELPEDVGSLLDHVRGVI